VTPTIKLRRHSAPAGDNCRPPRYFAWIDLHSTMAWMWRMQDLYAWSCRQFQ